MTRVRAVAVGIPERLRDELGGMTGVILAPDLSTAAGVLEDWPDAHVIYGEELFGMAVTGQPVFLLPEQGDPVGEARTALRRVWVIADAPPGELGDLPFDDPRQLTAHAAVRLRAQRLVDVSRTGAWVNFDALLDEDVDIPPE